MMTDFEQFKNREFLGDKFLNLVVADILLSRGMSRNEVNREIPKYTSTKALCSMFKKIGITESPLDKTEDPRKRKANAVEEYFFTQFLNNGYQILKEAVKVVLTE